MRQIGLTEILAIIDSNKFNYRNKIGEFKYIGIRDLVNNIRNNTLSKIDAKKDLNTLNKIKNAEIIKYKNHTPKHEELLNLFNNLSDTTLTDKTLMSSMMIKKMKMKMIMKMKMKMKMIIKIKMKMKMKMMMTMMMKQWIKRKKQKNK